MQAASIRLDGIVTDRLSAAPIGAVWVEAWDHDEKFKEVLASGITNKEGKFELTFDKALLDKAFAGRPHVITLKVLYKGTRLAYAPSAPIDLSQHNKPLALSITLPAAYGGDNIYQHLPGELRAEVEGLKKHGVKVLEKLRDEKVQAAFLQNPAQVLAEMGVPLSAQLRQRLSVEQPAKSVATPRAFRLLNGQIITPKIKINFTSGKE
jgi:hypothetical protein